MESPGCTRRRVGGPLCSRVHVTDTDHTAHFSICYESRSCESFVMQHIGYLSLKNKQVSSIILELVFHPHACHGGGVPATVPSTRSSWPSFRMWDEMKAFPGCSMWEGKAPAHFSCKSQQELDPPGPHPRPTTQAWPMGFHDCFNQLPSMGMEEGAESQ